MPLLHQHRAFHLPFIGELSSPHPHPSSHSVSLSKALIPFLTLHHRKPSSPYPNDIAETGGSASRPMLKTRLFLEKSKIGEVFFVPSCYARQSEQRSSCEAEPRRNAASALERPHEHEIGEEKPDVWTKSRLKTMAQSKTALLPSTSKREKRAKC